jgi:hypothetical protein
MTDPISSFATQMALMDAEARLPAVLTADRTPVTKGEQSQVNELQALYAATHGVRLSAERALAVVRQAANGADGALVLPPFVPPPVRQGRNAAVFLGSTTLALVGQWALTTTGGGPSWWVSGLMVAMAAGLMGLQQGLYTDDWAWGTLGTESTGCK